MQKSYTDRLEKLDKLTLPKDCIKKEFMKINKITDLEIAFDRHYKGLTIDGIIINDMTKSY